MRPSRRTVAYVPDKLALFPLHTVLLPEALLPLHIFEPRYRQLTVDLMQDTLPDRCFGVVAIRDSWITEITAVEQMHPIGCSAMLREAQRLPDGRFDIVTCGLRRFRVLGIDTGSAPYLMAEVQWLPDEPLPDGAGPAVARMEELTRAAYRRYCTTAWKSTDWHEPPAETGIAELSYQLAADCLLPLPDKQRLLDEINPLRRLHTVCRMLNREAGFLHALRAVPTNAAELGKHAPTTQN